MSGFDSSEDEECHPVDQTPFNVDWLDLSHFDCQEQLAIAGLPGCRFKNTWRNLERDLATLKELDIQEVFVMCTKGELNKYRVPRLLSEYSRAGLVLHHYPVPDGHVPSFPVLMKIIEEVRVNLMQGRRSLVHCRGGLGRSSLIGACLLLLLDQDLEPEHAIDKLRELKGPSAIQSVKQYNLIHDFREKKEEWEMGGDGVTRSVSR